MTVCTRCASTGRPMEMTDDGPVCLSPCSGRRPHLVLVADDPSELESLLLASLTARGAEARAMTQGLSKTLTAIERSVRGGGA